MDWWGLLKEKTETAPDQWEDFVQGIKYQFLPLDAQKTARKKYESLRQTGSIKEYNQAVSKILLDVHNVYADEDISRYISGLKKATQDHVELFDVPDLQTAMKHAEAFERVKFENVCTQPSGQTFENLL